MFDSTFRNIANVKELRVMLLKRKQSVNRVTPYPGNVSRFDVDLSTSHVNFLDFQQGFPTGRVREAAANVRDRFVSEISCPDDALP